MADGREIRFSVVADIAKIEGVDSFVQSMQQVSDTVNGVSQNIASMQASINSTISQGSSQMESLSTQTKSLGMEVTDVRRDISSFNEDYMRSLQQYSKMEDRTDEQRMAKQMRLAEIQASAKERAYALRERASDTLAKADILGLSQGVNRNGMNVGSATSAFSGMFDIKAAMANLESYDRQYEGAIRRWMPTFTSRISSLMHSKGGLGDLTKDLATMFTGGDDNGAATKAHTSNILDRMVTRLMVGEGGTGALLDPKMLQGLGNSRDVIKQMLTSSIIGNKGLNAFGGVFSMQRFNGNLKNLDSIKTANELLAGNAFNGLFGNPNSSGNSSYDLLTKANQMQGKQLSALGMQRLASAASSNALLSRALLNSNGAYRTAGMGFMLNDLTGADFVKLSNSLEKDLLLRVNGQNPNRKIWGGTTKDFLADDSDPTSIIKGTDYIRDRIAQASLAATKGSESFVTAKRAISRLSAGGTASEVLHAGDMVMSILNDEANFVDAGSAKINPVSYMLNNKTREKQNQFMIEKLYPFRNADQENARIEAKRKSFREQWMQGRGDSILPGDLEDGLEEMRRADYQSALLARSAEIGQYRRTNNVSEEAAIEALLKNSGSSTSRFAKMDAELIKRLETQVFPSYKLSGTNLKMGGKQMLHSYDAMNENAYTRALGLGAMDINSVTDVIKELDMSGLSDDPKDSERQLADFRDLLAQVGVLEKGENGKYIANNNSEYVLHASHGQSGVTARLIRRKEYEQVEKNFQDNFATPLAKLLGVDPKTFGSFWNNGVPAESLTSYEAFAKARDNLNKSWSNGIDMTGGAIDWINMTDEQGKTITFDDIVARIQNQGNAGTYLSSATQKALGQGGQLGRMALVDFSTLWAKRTKGAKAFGFDSTSEGQGYILKDLMQAGTFQGRGGMAGKGTISAIDDIAKAFYESGDSQSSMYKEDGNTIYETMLPSAYGGMLKVWSKFNEAGERIGGNYEGFIDKSFQKNKGDFESVYKQRLEYYQSEEGGKWAKDMAEEMATSDANKAFTLFYAMSTPYVMNRYANDSTTSSIGTQAAQWIKFSPAVMQHQAKALAARRMELQTPQGIAKYIYGGKDKNFDQMTAGLMGPDSTKFYQENSTRIDAEVEKYMESLYKDVSNGVLLDFSDDSKNDSVFGINSITGKAERFNSSRRGDGFMVGSIGNARVVTNPYMARLQALGITEQDPNKAAWANILDSIDQGASIDTMFGKYKDSAELKNLSRADFGSAVSMLQKAKQSLMATTGRGDKLTNEQLMGIMTLTGYGNKGDADYLAPGMIDFSNPNAMFEGLIRSPTGFGQIGAYVNYLPFMKDIITGLGFQDTGVYMNLGAMQKMAGADWDGDMIKTILSGKYSKESIANYNKSIGNKINTKNSADLFSWLTGNGTGSFRGMRASGSFDAKNPISSLVDDIANSDDAFRELGLYTLDGSDYSDEIGSVIDKMEAEVDRKSKVKSKNRELKAGGGIDDIVDDLLARARASQQMGLGSGIGSRLAGMNLYGSQNKRWAQIAMEGNRIYDIFTTQVKHPMDLELSDEYLSSLGLGGEWQKFAKLSAELGNIDEYKSANGQFFTISGDLINPSNIATIDIGNGGTARAVISDASLLKKASGGFAMDTMQFASRRSPQTLMAALEEMQLERKMLFDDRLANYYKNAMLLEAQYQTDKDGNILLNEYDEATRIGGGAGFGLADYAQWSEAEAKTRGTGLKYTKALMQNMRAIKGENLGGKHMIMTQEERNVNARLLALSSQEIDDYVADRFSRLDGSTIRLKNEFYDPEATSGKNSQEFIDYDQQAYGRLLKKRLGLNADAAVLGKLWTGTNTYLDTGITENALIASGANGSYGQSMAVKLLLSEFNPADRLNLVNTLVGDGTEMLSKYYIPDLYEADAVENLKALGFSDNDIDRIRNEKTMADAQAQLYGAKAQQPKGIIGRFVSKFKKQPEIQSNNPTQDPYVAYRRFAQNLLAGGEARVWDTETTGTETKGWNTDEILQASGMSVLLGSGIIGSFQGKDTLNRIKPNNKTSWEEAQAVHGIKPEDLANAPTASAGLTDFVKWLGGASAGLVGHNTEGFDQAALTNELFALGLNDKGSAISKMFQFGSSIDTLPLFKTLAADKNIKVGDKTLDELLEGVRMQTVMANADAIGEDRDKAWKAAQNKATGKFTLGNIARAFGIDPEGAHDANVDTRLTSFALMRGLSLIPGMKEEDSANFLANSELIKSQIIAASGTDINKLDTNLTALSGAVTGDDKLNGLMERIKLGGDDGSKAAVDLYDQYYKNVAVKGYAENILGNLGYTIGDAKVGDFITLPGQPPIQPSVQPPVESATQSTSSPIMLPPPLADGERMLPDGTIMGPDGKIREYAPDMPKPQATGEENRVVVNEEPKPVTVEDELKAIFDAKADEQNGSSNNEDPAAREFREKVEEAKRQDAEAQAAQTQSAKGPYITIGDNDVLAPYAKEGLQFTEEEAAKARQELAVGSAQIKKDQDTYNKGSHLPTNQFYSDFEHSRYYRGSDYYTGETIANKRAEARAKAEEEKAILATINDEGPKTKTGENTRIAKAEAAFGIRRESQSQQQTEQQYDPSTNRFDSNNYDKEDLEEQEIMGMKVFVPKAGAKMKSEKEAEARAKAEADITAAKVNEAKAEEAKAQEAKADQVVSDKQNAQMTAADAIITQAKVDEAKIEQTKAEEAKTEEAKAEQTKTEETKPEGTPASPTTPTGERRVITAVDRQEVKDKNGNVVLEGKYQTMSESEYKAQQEQLRVNAENEKIQLEHLKAAASATNDEERRIATGKYMASRNGGTYTDSEGITYTSKVARVNGETGYGGGPGGPGGNGGNGGPTDPNDPNFWGGEFSIDTNGVVQQLSKAQAQSKFLNDLSYKIRNNQTAANKRSRMDTDIATMAGANAAAQMQGGYLNVFGDNGIIAMYNKARDNQELRNVNPELYDEIMKKGETAGYDYIRGLGNQMFVNGQNMSGDISDIMGGGSAKSMIDKTNKLSSFLATRTAEYNQARVIGDNLANDERAAGIYKQSIAGDQTAIGYLRNNESVRQNLGIVMGSDGSMMWAENNAKNKSGAVDFNDITMGDVYNGQLDATKINLDAAKAKVQGALGIVSNSIETALDTQISGITTAFTGANAPGGETQAQKEERGFNAYSAKVGQQIFNAQSDINQAKESDLYKTNAGYKEMIDSRDAQVQGQMEKFQTEAGQEQLRRSYMQELNKNSMLAAINAENSMLGLSRLGEYDNRTISNHNLQFFGNNALTKTIRNNRQYVSQLKMNENSLERQKNAARADQVKYGTLGTADYDPKKLKQAEKMEEEANKLLARNQKEQKNWSGIGGLLKGFGGNLMASGFNFITNGFKSLINEAKKFSQEWETAMSKVSAKSGLTGSSLTNLGKTILTQAAQLKTSAPKLAETYATLFASGYNENNVTQAAAALTKYQVVTGQNLGKSVKQLNGVVESGLFSNLEQAMDALVAVSDVTTATPADITKILNKFSQIATGSGATSSEATALATVAAEALGGSTTAGSDLAVIMSRLTTISEAGKSDTDTVTDAQGNSFNVESIRSLEKLTGVSILNEDGLRNSIDIISDLAKAWDGMSDYAKSALTTTLGGTAGRQSNTFQGLMNYLAANPDKLQDYIDLAENSAGTVDNQYDILTNTSQYSKQGMTTAWNRVVANATDSESGTGWYTQLKNSAYDFAAFYLNMFADSTEKKKTYSFMGDSTLLKQGNQLSYLDEQIDNYKAILEKYNDANSEITNQDANSMREIISSIGSAFPELASQVNSSISSLTGFSDALQTIIDKRNELLKDKTQNAFENASYADIASQSASNVRELQNSENPILTLLNAASEQNKSALLAYAFNKNPNLSQRNGASDEDTALRSAVYDSAAKYADYILKDVNTAYSKEYFPYTYSNGTFNKNSSWNNATNVIGFIFNALSDYTENGDAAKPESISVASNFFNAIQKYGFVNYDGNTGLYTTNPNLTLDWFASTFLGGQYSNAAKYEYKTQAEDIADLALERFFSGTSYEDYGIPEEAYSMMRDSLMSNAYDYVTGMYSIGGSDYINRENVNAAIFGGNMAKYWNGTKTQFDYNQFKLDQGTLSPYKISLPRDAYGSVVYEEVSIPATTEEEAKAYFEEMYKTYLYREYLNGNYSEIPAGIDEKWIETITNEKLAAANSIIDGTYGFELITSDDDLATDRILTDSNRQYSFPASYVGMGEKLFEFYSKNGLLTLPDGKEATSALDYFKSGSAVRYSDLAMKLANGLLQDGGISNWGTMKEIDGMESFLATSEGKKIQEIYDKVADSNSAVPISDLYDALVSYALGGSSPEDIQKTITSNESKIKSYLSIKNKIASFIETGVNNFTADELSTILSDIGITDADWQALSDFDKRTKLNNYQTSQANQTMLAGTENSAISQSLLNSYMQLLGIDVNEYTDIDSLLSGIFLKSANYDNPEMQAQAQEAIDLINNLKSSGLYSLSVKDGNINVGYNEGASYSANGQSNAFVSSSRKINAKNTRARAAQLLSFGTNWKTGSLNAWGENTNLYTSDIKELYPEMQTYLDLLDNTNRTEAQNRQLEELEVKLNFEVSGYEDAKSYLSDIESIVQNIASGGAEAASALTSIYSSSNTVAQESALKRLAEGYYNEETGTYDINSMSPELISSLITATKAPTTAAFYADPNMWLKNWAAGVTANEGTYANSLMSIYTSGLDKGSLTSEEINRLGFAFSSTATNGYSFTSYNDLTDAQKAAWNEIFLNQYGYNVNANYTAGASWDSKTPTEIASWYENYLNQNPLATGSQAFTALQEQFAEHPDWQNWVNGIDSVNTAFLKMKNGSYNAAQGLEAVKEVIGKDGGTLGFNGTLSNNIQKTVKSLMEAQRLLKLGGYSRGKNGPAKDDADNSNDEDTMKAVADLLDVDVSFIELMSTGEIKKMLTRFKEQGSFELTEYLNEGLQGQEFDILTRDDGSRYIDVAGLQINIDEPTVVGAADGGAAAAAVQEWWGAEAASWMSVAGASVTVAAEAKADGETATLTAITSDVTKPATTPYSSPSGGGGGSSETKTDKLLKKFKRKWATNTHHINMVQAQMSRYEELGQLASYGNMIELESVAEAESIEQYKEAIAELKTEMAKLGVTQKMLDEKDSGSSITNWYAMRDAIFEYEEAIEEANTNIIKNNKLLRENRQAMRDTRTELENMILETLESNEEYRKSMLDGRVQMEDLILQTLQDQYEKEWDLQKEDLERKKEALEEEKQMISDRLNARKEAEEQANQYEELNKLQQQAALLSMDATQTAAVLDLQNKISELMRTLAWSEAENIVEARQQEIDDQISSIDQFIEDEDERVGYYIEDATNFSQQVADILGMSSEDIMDWLKANVDEYGKMLDAAQQQQVESWLETYKAMLGITDTYWDQINAIIDGGIEAVLETMMSSQEFQTASATQQLSMIYEWQETFDAYTNAFEGTAISEAYDQYMEAISQAIEAGDSVLADSLLEEYIVAMTGTANYAHIDELPIKSTRHSSEDANVSYISNNTDLIRDNTDAILTDLDGIYQSIAQPGFITVVVGDDDTTTTTTDPGSYTKYATGGLVNTTGPAWLDGNPGEPEYVLNPDNFNMLLQSLELAKTLMFDPYTTMITPDIFGSANTDPSIGDVHITINEASISSDYDVARLAQQVGEQFVKQLETNGYRTGRF